VSTAGSTRGPTIIVRGGVIRIKRISNETCLLLGYEDRVSDIEQIFQADVSAGWLCGVPVCMNVAMHDGGAKEGTYVAHEVDKQRIAGLFEAGREVIGLNLSGIAMRDGHVVFVQHLSCFCPQ